MDSWKKIGKSRYVNDKQITDHYAIIPTGQGLGNAGRSVPPGGEGVSGDLPPVPLAFFYPAAVHTRGTAWSWSGRGEHFFASFKVLVRAGVAEGRRGLNARLNAGVEESLGEDQEAAENASADAGRGRTAPGAGRERRHRGSGAGYGSRNGRVRPGRSCGFQRTPARPCLRI